MRKKYFLSASLICGDMMNLGEQIKKLSEAKIDYIHIDVMDGHFVPRFGLFPEIVKQVREISKIPMDVHLMTNNPEPYIKDFIDAGANIICIHAEENYHLHRTIKMIRDMGAKAGIVLNIATPLNVLDYILDDISMVILMAINPGIVGHKIIPKIYDKIADVKEKLKNYPDILLEIDGGVTPETIPLMLKAGANMFVCGTGTIFRPTSMVKEKTLELREKIDAEFNF